MKYLVGIKLRFRNDLSKGNDLNYCTGKNVDG